MHASAKRATSYVIGNVVIIVAEKRISALTRGTAAVEGLGAKMNSTSLRCPVCCVVTKLGAKERLSVNWLAKDVLNSLENIPETIVCRSCSTSVPRNQSLDCRKCSEERNLASMLICGRCAVTELIGHITKVETGVCS